VHNICFSESESDFLGAHQINIPGKRALNEIWDDGKLRDIKRDLCDIFVW